MGAAWAWARSELRRRRGAAVALVLLIGVSGAVVLTAAAGARRTSSAFDRFLTSSNAADVQLQYSPTEGVEDRDVLDAIRRHPDVEVAAPLYVTVGFSEDSDYDLGIFASPDPALFRDIDRPRLLEGRLPDPTAADEILVNRFTRDNLGVHVGDTVRIGTFSAEQFGVDEPSGPPAGPVLEMHVVGVSITPYDVADDEFVGAFSTPAYFAAHWGDVGGFGPMVEVATRDGGDPSAAVEEALAGFDLSEVDLTPSSELTAKVEDGTRVLATGLGLFAAVAGLSALVACAQALHRRVADASRDQHALRSMGFTRAQRGGAIGLAIAPVVLLGTTLALTIAVPASATMPIGAARTAEPHPGIDVDSPLLVLGGAVLAGVLLLLAAQSTWRIGRRDQGEQPAAPRRSNRARLLRARLSPPVNLGVAMAIDPGAGGGATVPVRSALLGAAVGAAGVVAVLTFAASLDSLVEDPARSGWNWTLAPDLASEEDLATLLTVPGVEDVGRIIHRQVVVDGEQLLGLAVESEKGSPSLTVLRGRMPSGPREIAVAPKLADRSHLELGDSVSVEDTSGGERAMVVVGEVLLPTFDDNPFNDGAAVAPGVIDQLAQSDGFDQVVVRFEAGTSRREAARRLTGVLPDALSVYSYPSLPPDVANLEAVQFLPRLLGVFLAVLALAAVGHALATSVRRRRRDLGIVRSLGFQGRDVHRIVTAQSATLVAAGLVVGVPVGLAIGRVSWRIVAEDIGVSAAPTTSPAELLGLALGGLVVSALLASLPGRAAARLRAADALRSE